VKQPVRRERNTADYGYPSPDISALSAKALEVTQRLTNSYGEVPFSSKDPMSQLVDIILSHRTRDEQTAAAYDNLLKRFGSWEAVRDAPTEEVQDTIANVSWPEVKAPRLQFIMRQITEERGNLNQFASNSHAGSPSFLVLTSARSDHLHKLLYSLFLRSDPGRNAGIRTALYSIGLFVLKLRPRPPLCMRV
jgi:hypothetical protein